MALKCRESARIPIVAHVDPYSQPSRLGMDPALAAELGTVEWFDGSSISLSRSLGTDIMDYMQPPVQCARKKVTIESSSDGPDSVTVWHTPAGDLREVRRQSRETGTSYLVEHMVKAPSDIPALAAIFNDETWTTDGTTLKEIADRRKLIGDDGTLMLFTDGTPMGMMYRIFCGVETLAYLWADAKSAMLDLFKTMERTYVEKIRLSSACEADVIVGIDDTSTTVISPAMFEEASLAITDNRAGILHRAGKLYVHHSCGLIRDLLPLYRRTSMDAVHAFTSPPIGNVTIAEGRRLLGDGIAIIATIPQMTYPFGDREAIRRNIHSMVRESAAAGHVILNLAADPNRTLDEHRFVADCYREAINA